MKIVVTGSRERKEDIIERAIKKLEMLIEKDEDEYLNGVMAIIIEIHHEEIRND